MIFNIKYIKYVDVLNMCEPVGGFNINYYFYDYNMTIIMLVVLSGPVCFSFLSQCANCHFTI